MSNGQSKGPWIVVRRTPAADTNWSYLSLKRGIVWDREYATEFPTQEQAIAEQRIQNIMSWWEVIPASEIPTAGRTCRCPKPAEEKETPR